MKLNKKLLAVALLTVTSAAAQASAFSSGDVLLGVFNGSLSNGLTFDVDLTTATGLAGVTDAGMLTQGYFTLDLSTQTGWTAFAATLTSDAKWGVVAGGVNQYEATSTNSAVVKQTSLNSLNGVGQAVNLDIARIFGGGLVTGNSAIVSDVDSTLGGWASSAGSANTLANIWGTNANISAAGALDTSLNFFAASGVNTGTGLNKKLVETDVQLQSFKLTSAGVLTYGTAPVSEVPLPAAAWMFVTGLLGFLGLNRRKTAV